MATSPVVTDFKAVFDSDPADATLAFKRAVFAALIPNYMKPSTATLDASIQTDAMNKTKRLKAAFDELMKVAP